MYDGVYSDKVIDHFTNPRNVGEIENPSGVGTVGNAKCGDIMRIFLDIDENGIIRDCKFKTFGCGAAVATSSMATEMVKGKSVQEALQLTNKAEWRPSTGSPRSRYTAPSWRRRRSTLRCGTMRRKTVWRSRA